VHDFTGGILSSGLVWTVPVADESITPSDNGARLDVDVQDVPVIDAAPAQTPATVSFQMSWRGRGRARHLGRGATVAPTDPSAFVGRFFHTRVRGTFSGASGGFTFTSRPRFRTLFAELGAEQTGALIPPTVRCNACSGAGAADPGSPSPW
jgi:hypothetical protein